MVWPTSVEGREGGATGDVSVSACLVAVGGVTGRKDMPVCECLSLVYITHAPCAVDGKNRVNVCQVSWERETLSLTHGTKLRQQAERGVHMHTAMGLDQKGNNNESQCLACHGVPAKRKVQTKRANPTPGGAFQASKQASKRSFRLSGDAASRWCPSR